MKNPLLAAALSLAVLLFSQCDRPEDPTPPANLLPRQKMISMLVSVHILESRIEQLHLPTDSSRVLYRHLSEPVFQHYQTDKKTFEESLHYYAVHGKDLEEIYEAVTDSITQRQPWGGTK